MANEIKGFEIDGTVYKYDYQELANKPAALPNVSISDRDKFLRVNTLGEWAAIALPSAEEASF